MKTWLDWLWVYGVIVAVWAFVGQLILRIHVNEYYDYSWDRSNAAFWARFGHKMFRVSLVWPLALLYYGMRYCAPGLQAARRECRAVYEYFQKVHERTQRVLEHGRDDD